MSQNQHAYFGVLDTSNLQSDDIIWEREMLVSGKEVRVKLWAREGVALPEEALDAYAKLLTRLPELDALARPELVKYLKEHADFIGEYMAAVEDGHDYPTVKALLQSALRVGQTEIAPEDFESAMQLRSISLWCPSYDEEEEDDSEVVFDYRIDPETSDQILAVKFDAQGKLELIAWES